MTPLQWVIVIVVIGFALLVARGMMLIGQGGAAEQQARSKAADSAVVDSGWFLLDWLRTAELPTIAYFEEKLGINQDDDE